jgi:DNA-directed RNA polymerase specialized sigma24 family protein
MLGSASEAEDAVQETWLRLSRSDTRELDNPCGWLTTVVAVWTAAANLRHGARSWIRCISPSST